MAERDIIVDHSTLHRWVIRPVPVLDKALRRYKPLANGRNLHQSQRAVEISVPAVDTAGQTIDFLLTARRDASAALRLFRKAIRHHDEPQMVTIDKSGANTAALTVLNADKPGEESITIGQNKYLNNLVEQDHRNIERRTRPMLGFKSFRRAQTILAGIELVNMIRKGQFDHPVVMNYCRLKNFICWLLK